MCIAAALCFGLGGVLTGIAVSFYAATVVSDFYATGGMTGVGLSNMGGVNSMQGEFYIFLVFPIISRISKILTEHIKT